MRFFGLTILGLVILILVLFVTLAIFSKTPTTEEGTPLVTNDTITRPTEPTITPVDPSRGKSNAKTTIVEFSDFLCPHCADASATMDQFIREYPNDVRHVWKDLPSPYVRKKSMALHVAAHCAHEQGAFWEYHNLLFQNPPGEGAEEQIMTLIAQTLKLNLNRFTTCQKSGRMQALVERNIHEGELLNVTATPTFFINSKRYEGALTIQQLRDSIAAPPTP